MTEPQLRAKIEYSVKMRQKHQNLEQYFNSKLQELRADLWRMRKGPWVVK